MILRHFDVSTPSNNTCYSNYRDSTSKIATYAGRHLENKTTFMYRYMIYCQNIREKHICIYVIVWLSENKWSEGLARGCYKENQEKKESERERERKESFIKAKRSFLSSRLSLLIMSLNVKKKERREFLFESQCQRWDSNSRSQWRIALNRA